MKRKVFKRNNVTTGSALFKRWLVNSERVDEKTCEDYIAVLIELNQDIKTKGFSAQKLFSVNVEEAVATIRELLNYPGFDDYLEQRANDKPVIIKYADYNELDRNRHVNNSRYTAWAYDALFKQGIDVSLIEDIIINYNSEVLAGEKVELFISQNIDKISVYGYKNTDTKVFAAELTLKQA